MKIEHDDEYVVYASWEINKFFRLEQGGSFRPGMLILEIMDQLPFLYVYQGYSWEPGKNGSERCTKIYTQEIKKVKVKHYTHLFDKDTKIIELHNTETFDFFEFQRMGIPL